MAGENAASAAPTSVRLACVAKNANAADGGGAPRSSDVCSERSKSAMASSASSERHWAGAHGPGRRGAMGSEHETRARLGARGRAGVRFGEESRGGAEEHRVQGQQHEGDEASGDEDRGRL